MFLKAQEEVREGGPQPVEDRGDGGASYSGLLHQFVGRESRFPVDWHE